VIKARAETRARLGARAREWTLAYFCFSGACIAANGAQPDAFLMRSSPAPTYVEPAPQDYNLKFGRLKARFHGSIQSEYSDNINLEDSNPSSDVFFYPNIGVGFQWPISARNILEFNLGFGYRAYVDNPQLNSLQVTPDSRLLYQMRIGKVNVLLRDNFTLQVDPLTRPDISGTGGTLIDFKRINNDIGLQAEWQARKNLALVGSYDYVMDRTLNRQFQSLDRDDHTFAFGGYSNFGPAWNVGLNNSLTLTEYQQRIQNDGYSYSVGPQVTLKATRFITIDTTVSYTISKYDQTGTITDRSDFSGVSFSLGVKHNLNSRFSHNLRAGKSISPGFGSNFNELSVLQYGVNWRLNSFLNVNSTFSYEHLDASGAAGERADRYLWYVGSGWQVARRWSIGVGYGFAWKNSDQPARDYQQNRVTIDLTHQF
jgi:hypothetical protein